MTSRRSNPRLHASRRLGLVVSGHQNPACPLVANKLGRLANALGGQRSLCGCVRASLSRRKMNLPTMINTSTADVAPGAEAPFCTRRQRRYHRRSAPRVLCRLSALRGQLAHTALHARSANLPTSCVSTLDLKLPLDPPVLSGAGPRSEGAPYRSPTCDELASPTLSPAARPFRGWPRRRRRFVKTTGGR